MTRPSARQTVKGAGLRVTLGKPEPGVSYPEVLTDRQAPDALRALRALVGILVGISLYMVLVPLVATLVIAAGYSLDGSTESWTTYLPDAMAFHHPWGLLGTNLGLAMLILISLGLVHFLHGRSTRWLSSVQPGMRWRYLLLCLPAAIAVLGGMQVLGAGSLDGQAQPRIWLWLALVLISSPLQAAGEEFFFRGYLMQAFGSMVPARQSARVVQIVSVVASAALFAAFHGVQNVPMFVDRFGFGLLAGFLVVLTGGLEGGIACHVVNNLMAFAWAAFHGGISQARALQSIGWAQAVTDLVAFGIFGVLACLLARPMRLARTTPGASPEVDGGRFGTATETR